MTPAPCASRTGRACTLGEVLCRWPSWLFTNWASMPSCRCHCVSLNAAPSRYCLRSGAVCLAACGMFAGSLAWLFIAFRGACAQLSKRELVPSRVCTKQLGGSLNKHAQPCSVCCQLCWAAPGEGKQSLPAKESGKNSCLINKSIGN